MQQIPATIAKHFIGYVAILGTGVGLAALLWAAAVSLHRSGQLAPELGAVLYFASAVVLLITIVQIWVYSLSYYEINEQGLRVVNWHTLFWKTDTTTEWARIQDATVSTGSVFSLLFAYGTLTVQTAGTAQTLKMTMTPDPEYWQAIVQAMADETTEN